MISSMFCDKYDDATENSRFLKFKSLGSSTNRVLSVVLLKLVLIIYLHMFNCPTKLQSKSFPKYMISIASDHC